MRFSSISDLGQNLMLRRQGADLKTNLARLTQELTTGVRLDVGRQVRGDFGPLAGLERSLSRLEGFSSARSDLSLRISGIQSSLSTLENVVASFGSDLVSSASLEQPDVLNAKLSSAPDRLDQVVSLLNTQVTGRFLFSGISTDQKPLSSGEEILTQVRNIASTAVDVTDFRTQVDAWFLDSGGGFESFAYGGADVAQNGISISETQAIDVPIKADDLIFRETLRDLAIASVISEGSLNTTEQEKREILTAVGTSLIASENALIGLQRDTGVTESFLSEAEVASETERNVLELALNKIISSDPYETASELEAVQYQIETLYVITARTSQLKLSDYL